MKQQFQYLGLEEARQVLAEMGIALTPRQMKRAAETNASGQRKLPFFVDPVEGTLKIERQALVDVYVRRQRDAQQRCRPVP